AGIALTSTVPSGITIDSQSLLPVLQNTGKVTRYVYAERFGSTIGASSDDHILRNEQYKLIQFNDGHEEFYDLLEDPYEAVNLLGTSLTATQQANYYNLVMRLGAYQTNGSAPVITGFSKAENQFTISVQGSTNVTDGLWR